MRLKSLKLAGFKSFANPTTFTFKHDITAIVGPNGCGKSNVIDAIRWVLGETSAKQLRGGAMSDVIFAGTDGRAARSQASVELTFEHTQDEQSGIRHALNLYQELTLRRQITSEGKSDYFINGQRVRRRDVVDVFLGTGLSSRSYAVIEQGMIGRIIDADGEKLREFIEEAAGVSRYQVRRLETQKQLETATDNLLRLQDLQSELTKQQKTLQKQAESATRYQTLKKELERVEGKLLRHRLYDAWHIYQKATNQSQELGQQASEQQKTLANLRQKESELAQKVAEVGFLKDKATTEHHQHELLIQSAHHAHEKALSEEQNLSTLLARLEIAQENSYEQNIDEHQKQLEQISPQLVQIDSQINELIVKRQVLDEQFLHYNHTHQSLSEERQSLSNQLAVGVATLSRLKISLDKWQQKSQSLTAPTHEVIDDSQKIAMSEEMASLDRQLEHLEDEQATQAPILTSLTEQLNTHKAKLVSLEKTHAKLASEYDTLHKLTYPPKPKADKVALSTPNLPKLSEMISLSKQGKEYAQRLDYVLSVMLGDGVGSKDDWQAQLQSIWFDGASHHAMPRTLPQGVVALSSLIDKPRLQVFEAIFLLDETLGQQSFEELCQLVGVDKDSLCVFVSSTGAIIHRFGVKFLGEDNEQLLSQRQAQIDRLQVLDDELNDSETQIEELGKLIKSLEQDTHQKTLVNNERLAQITAKHRRLAELKTEYTAMSAKLDAMLVAKEVYAKQRLELDDEKKHLDDDYQKLSQAQSDHEQALTELEPKLKDAQKQLDDHKESQFQLKKSLATLQEDKQKLTLAQAQHAQSLVHAQKAKEQAVLLEEQRQKDKADTAQKLSALALALQTLQKQHQDAIHAGVDSKAKLEEYSQEHQALLDEHATIKQSLENTQSQSDEMTAKVSVLKADVAVALARLQDLVEKYQEHKNPLIAQKDNQSANQTSDTSPPSDETADNQSSDELSVEPNHEPSLNEPTPDEPKSMDISELHRFMQTILAEHESAKDNSDIATLSGEQKKLSSQIANLGAVNLTAKKELDELNERLAPMNKEMTDVQESINKLNDAITTINAQTKKLFMDMLDAVNVELNSLFSKVFGGGQASLTLMDDDSLPKADKWRAGLVLMAQPKGKKNSRLAVLSGGEKTLTALSLIFAIFKQHPAPFCVLDEVDAPLDDANVARFTSLIGELASNVQFIFISHNKLAMQSAHELKGVTMPTAGISSLVSVNLDEATAMIN